MIPITWRWRTLETAEMDAYGLATLFNEEDSPYNLFHALHHHRFLIFAERAAQRV